MTNYSNIRTNDFNLFASGFIDYIEKLWDDGCLSELAEYIPDKSEDRWNMEKVKIVLDVLKLKNRDEAETILSYIEHPKFGWQGSTYRLRNHCLRGDRNEHCKKNHMIDNTQEATSDAFEDIDEIFLNEEYGSITTYLFGYCLSALFSSRLKRDGLRVPYFLQIACERESNIYRLIHEIVEICDVNTGLIKKCSMDFDYGYCDYDYVTVFPTQFTDKTLNDLVRNRDVPVIIDGYENEKFYGTLLRETANIPGKTRNLDIKDRFNILPIFICPIIRSQFKNVFSMDLTGLDIDEEYLKIIQENKQRLASWALELVKYAKEYFIQRNTMVDQIYHKSEDERPFFDNINGHINRIQKTHRQYTQLTSRDVANIGFLTYFISRYMDVFKKSIRLNEGTKFTYRCNWNKHNPAELITGIEDEIVESLFKLHNTNSPTLPMIVNIGTSSTDPAKAKMAKKKGAKYAKDIVKYYQSYGVSIRILPDAVFKDDRYIFSVKLLPGTDGKLINRYADEVRRLLELGFLCPDISSSSIKIIASEKPLKENSLIKILESEKFRESKMEIPYAVGYDIMGEMEIADLAKFPHLLVGGASNSGKSSALHSILMSIVCKQRSDKVKLLILDFGASRLKMFENVPHMIAPIIKASEIEKGRKYILALQVEMERRLQILDSIDERKYKKELKKWPSIVCVIDEFPTFIRKLTAGKENRMSYMLLIDLLERARKVKVHIILAAQDATKENIEIKKTNLGAAIAFRCTNPYDSKAIINAPDAVNLSGKGSMYFVSEQHPGIKRLQGAFMEPEEIMDMLDNMKFDYGDIEGEFNEVLSFSQLLTQSSDAESEPDSSESEDEGERLLVQIVMLMLDKNKISNNQIKNHFGMGYERANDFLEDLENLEIISKLKKGTKLARTINADKARAFLEEHGYTNDDTKTAISQKPDIDDMPIDIMLDQNINTTADMKEVSEQQQNDSASGPLNAEVAPKLKSKTFRIHSDRQKFRKNQKGTTH